VNTWIRIDRFPPIRLVENSHSIPQLPLQRWKHCSRNPTISRGFEEKSRPHSDAFFYGRAVITTDRHESLCFAYSGWISASGIHHTRSSPHHISRISNSGLFSPIITKHQLHFALATLLRLHPISSGFPACREYRPRRRRSELMAGSDNSSAGSGIPNSF